MVTATIFMALIAVIGTILVVWSKSKSGRKWIENL